MSRDKLSKSPEDGAWGALGSVEDHPQVREWLAQADELAEASLRADKEARWWRSHRAMAASALLTLGIAVGSYLHWAADRYQTGVGEQRDVTLADGSRITLNTDTAVAVKYSKSRRYIEMKRGEALFTVKTDPRRPFDVSAGGTLTRALGTEFNVDLRSAKVTVSVLDGAVQVVPASGTAVNTVISGSTRGGGGDAGSIPVSALAKGQALEFRKKDGRMQQQKANLHRIDAWRTRRLEFTDMPLTDAVDEFNRYSTLRVVVGTPDLAAVRVSGVFRIGDVEGFLYSLREALKIETHAAPGEVVLMRGGS